MRSGVTATYWKITSLNIDIQQLKASVVISPFLDEENATARSSSVGPGKTYNFVLDEANVFSRTLNQIYTAILARANSSVPNLLEEGTHLFDPDLAGGSIV